MLRRRIVGCVERGEGGGGGGVVECVERVHCV